MPTRSTWAPPFLPWTIPLMTLALAISLSTLTSATTPARALPGATLRPGSVHPTLAPHRSDRAGTRHYCTGLQQYPVLECAHSIPDISLSSPSRALSPLAPTLRISSRVVQVPRGAAHGWRTYSFHPVYFPSPGQQPCSDPHNVPGPGHLLPDREPFVPPLAPPTARYLLIPSPALLVQLSPDTCAPTQCRAQARRPPAASLSSRPCRAARPPGGLSPGSHSPGIPSPRKGSVSFPGVRATNLEAGESGGGGGVASRRANPSLGE